MPQEAARHIEQNGRHGARAILLIDSDESARETLTHQLRFHGDCIVDEATNAEAALALVGRRPYHAVILEVRLPDMDGQELCRLIRRRNLSAPIILMSPAPTDSDIILGLDAGADDYVANPCRFSVLLARLRAHLRRFERSDDAVLTVGPYLFGPARNALVEIGGRRRIHLTNKEARILKYLYWNRGKAIDRAGLMREVWSSRTDLETHTVQTHVYRLRRKIEPDPTEPQIILSTPRGGYSLCADWPPGPSARSADADRRISPLPPIEVIRAA